MYSDYFNHPRPIGTSSDIGIYEYSPDRLTYVLPPEFNDTTLFANYVSTFAVDPIPMSEPVKTDLKIAYTLDTMMNVAIDIYNIEGDRIYHDEVQQQPKGAHTWTVNATGFPEGLCLFTIRSGNQAYSGRFFKTK